MAMHKQFYHKLTLLLLLIVLVLPLLATLLYSLSSSWGASILPDGLTLKWYQVLFSDSRFIAALFTSTWVCIASLLLTLCLVIPTIFVIYCYFPKLKGLMNLLILLPFAVPPIVSSVGLLELFSSEPLILTGTPWLLMGAFFTVALPFMYRTVANNMEALNLNDMMDTAHLLGASTLQIFFRVILPNLRKGIMVSIFLCFSLLFGEFVFANMLAGSHLETIQVYLFSMRHGSGHICSAIVISYFLVILLMIRLTALFSKQA